MSRKERHLDYHGTYTAKVTFLDARAPKKRCAKANPVKKLGDAGDPDNSYFSEHLPHEFFPIFTTLFNRLHLPVLVNLISQL